VTDLHPDLDTLRAFARGQLDEPELVAIQRHLDGCDQCCTVLDRPDIEDTFVNRVRVAGGTRPDTPNGNSPPATQDTPRASGLPAVPGYEVLEEIGRGGMGVVYKARQVGLNRLVALKVLLAGPHASLEHLARFRAEAEAVARVQHPNIVQIYEVGKHGELAFLALEFVPGGSLETRLNGQPLPAREAARLAEGIARGVHAAHQQGIAHRDLKPANVLLAEDGTPRVTDFGLAKRLDVDTGLTRSWAVMGTPSYMAPEQARGQSRDAGVPADVYSLGACLYEMLTGRPPFQGASGSETLLQVLSNDPVPVQRLVPGVPRDLETICHRCLRKDPVQRYANCQELGDDLRRWLAGEPIRARPLGLAERMVRWLRRRPFVPAAALIALAATIWAIQGYLSNPERVREKARRDHARGLPVTLVGETGPPIGFRWAEGEASTFVSSARDKPFHVSTVSTALIELWEKPHSAYSFRADIHHENNPGGGEIGLYLGARRPDPPVSRLCCYVISFADCGRNVNRFRNQAGQAGSRVHIDFFYFPSGPGMARFPGGHQRISDGLFFVPPLDFTPTPWRTIEVHVSAEGIDAWWTGEDGEARRVAWIPRKDLAFYAAQMKGMKAEIGACTFDPQEPGAFGLYVRNGAASFRNVVLGPLEAGR
jgi:hypothetical protein